MKSMEKLKRDLQKIKNERDGLQGILANYTNKDLNNRIKIRTFMLKMQHDQVMTDLKRMPQDISEALYKYKELTKENQFYSSGTATSRVNLTISSTKSGCCGRRTDNC
ncbi:mCG1048396 [Mus musculus]|nr:mCG1048396 [Mus musculus]